MSYGICPVCNGTGRVPAGNEPYKKVMYGYDAETDTHICRNCGGQTMYGKPTGKVPLRPDGTPCQHKYTGKTIGRCLTLYTCSECGHSYEIDSGD